MAQLLMWVGGLLPAWLLGMLLKWAIRKVRRTGDVIVPAHLIAMVLASLLNALGRADGGSPDFIAGAIQAIPPQIVWLVFDLRRQSRVLKETASS